MAEHPTIPKTNTSAEDGLNFEIAVAADGRVNFLPQTLTMACERYKPQTCKAGEIEQIKSDITDSIQTHLHELHFTPRQYRCKTYDAKLRITFSMSTYFRADYEQLDKHKKLE